MASVASPASSGFASPTDDKLIRSLLLVEYKHRRLQCDLKWAIFCSSLTSFKRDTLVKPFPPMFQYGDEKDFDALATVCRNIGFLCHAKVDDLTHLEAELLYWVLMAPQRFSLNCATKSELDDIIKLQEDLQPEGKKQRLPVPNYVFSVDYAPDVDAKFVRLKGDRKVFRAFHGSRLANFYSILNHGLIANLNKTSAFGEGTYLSSDLAVSLNWSPLSTPGCGQVELGDRLSCVALCDVIDDPSGVKYCTEPSVSVQTAFNDSVPEKYMIVQNDELLRIKYLLVFAEKTPKNSRKGALQRRVRDFLFEHRFVLLMLLYALMLVAVGLWNSPRFNVLLRRVSDYWYRPSSYDEF